MQKQSFFSQIIFFNFVSTNFYNSYQWFLYSQIRVSGVAALQTNGQILVGQTSPHKQKSGQQRSFSAECKTTLACTTRGSSSAMLTIVMDVKTMTQSVPISRLNIVIETSACQGT